MKKFFQILGRSINILRIVFLNVLFFGLLIALFSSISEEPTFDRIEDSGIVTVGLSGFIVEQVSVDDNLSALTEDQPQQILLFEVIKAIDEAANDDRVTGMVLLPGGLMGSSYAALNEIGDALLRFKDAGKPIITTAPYLSQGAYYLASFADEIYIGPMGAVDVTGLASFRPYFGEFLERYGVDVNVFKVGTYKSAVEPYQEQGMSPAARENAEQWMGDLWASITTDIEANRNLDQGTINRWLDHYPETLSAHDGDFAAMALEMGLIDGIKVREARIERLQEFANSDKEKIGVSWQDYLYQRELENVQIGERPTIAVVVASGQIVDGSQPPGMIGGKSTADLIEMAVEENNAAAIVLRVNSPGGSAAASEVIREQLIAAQAQDIPVVVSMGGVAASGGYWISTNADYIFANEQTITGSIGVFGLVPTFGRLANEYGIYADGVATTPIAGGFDPINGLNEPMRRTIQLSIEHTYRQFVNLVAESRHSTYADINEIAQGRVWSGQRALNIGLIDEFGTLEDALIHAAKLADINDYQVTYMEQPLSTFQQLIQTFEKSSSVLLPMSTTERLTRELEIELEKLQLLNDPNHVYATCFGCDLQF